MTDRSSYSPRGETLRRWAPSLPVVGRGLKRWLGALLGSSGVAWVVEQPQVAAAITLGGLCAGLNYVLSAGWLSRLINRRIGVASFVSILLAKALGLLLLGALMIGLRIAEPFSLGVSFAISTVVIAALLSFPSGGPSAKV